MKRLRPAMFVLFSGILTLLVFFGSQLKVRTLLASPSFTQNRPAALGTNTCAVSGCHVSKGSPGTATITGFPLDAQKKPTYSTTPIPLTVTINDTTQNGTFAFELTARLASNTALAAGTFVADASTSPGTNVVPVIQGGGSKTPTFTFMWNPPTTAAGPVNFYLSGMAGSCCSDDLYTVMIPVTPAAGGGGPVSQAPMITAPPTSLTVTAGQSATFSVTATGTPTPTYQWMKGGANISGATSSSYTIPSTTTADSGAYTVMVTNSAGSATGGPATLTVKTAPTPTPTPTPTPPPTGCNEDCGSGSSMNAVPFVNDPNSSGALTAAWVDNLGSPHNTSDPLNRGLILANGSASTGALAGAVIQNVTGMSLTELGFDFRAGIQCSADSPHFVVVTTDGVSHTVGGCSSSSAAGQSNMPMGWMRLRFDPGNATPAISPTDHVQSISVVVDKGPTATQNAAGSIVVIDNIYINGAFTGKGSSSSTPTPTPRPKPRDD